MASDPSATPFVWKRTTVEGRPALYAVVGDGLPVVLAHGWALGQRSYRKAAERLVAQGCRVYLPALPGFGGTPDLPERSFSLAGYAEWLDGFMTAVKLQEPAFVVGHSFGGGVAISLAYDFPERVRTLVLVNSIGGSAWQSGSTVRTLAERPLWDWGIHVPADVLPIPQLRKVLPVVLEDALPNMLRNPRAMWKVGNLARRADLTAELEELKRRGLPVVVLWGRRDKIIPQAAFESLCAAIGAEGEVVDGNHSWLIADPDGFAEIITNAVDVAKLARDLGGDDDADGEVVDELPSLTTDRGRPPAG